MSWTLLQDYNPEQTADSFEQALSWATDCLRGESLCTAIILDERGNICRFQTTRRIVTTASKVEGVATVRAVQDIDLDVTTAVLMMHRSEIFALEYDSATALDLAYLHAPGVAAVNEARLVESICEFFAIDMLEDLTDERLEAAALDVLGGYVEETVTFQLEVKVRRPANGRAAASAHELQHTAWSNTPHIRVLSSAVKDS
jgi:hypothetical protein